MSMRPKKPRIIDDIQLADNLYPDPRKRVGYYQLKLPDGRMKVFPASSPQDANEIAAECLTAYVEGVAPEGCLRREHLAFHVPLYFKHMEKLNPDLVEAAQWNNHKSAYFRFTKHFPLLSDLEYPRIEKWWHGLSYYMQKHHHSSFRDWFNWLSSEGLTPKLAYNPFTKSFDKPRLVLKKKPKKQRPKLIVQVYRKIFEQAGALGYEGLQLAQGISLYTTMREEDICALRRKENLVDGKLQVTMGKSEAMHGAIGAARREWVLSEHPILKRMIDRCLELCLINSNCPYLISHRPERIVKGRHWNSKTDHICMVRPDRLSRMFAEARDAAFPGAVFDRKTNPGVCFHEVRGLSSTLYRKAGYTQEQVQFIMTHEDATTTKGYQDPDEIPFEKVELKLTAEELFF